jgi:hypothetical protein
MGALLQAKQTASAAMQARRAEQPLPRSVSSSPSNRPSTTANTSPNVVRQPPVESPPEGSGDKPISTTERLLALKRKRDEDN